MRVNKKQIECKNFRCSNMTFIVFDSKDKVRLRCAHCGNVIIINKKAAVRKHKQSSIVYKKGKKSKRCGICKKLKSLKYFSTTGKSKISGNIFYMSYCRECEKVRRRKVYRTRPDIREYYLNYYRLKRRRSDK